jgi:flagellar biosynthetic protein FliQ
MNSELATELFKTMIFQAISIVAPVLLTAMVIGIIVSVFQAATTIHEQTFTLPPKALGVLGIMLLFLPWILRSLMEFAIAVVEQIPQLVQ